MKPLVLAAAMAALTGGSALADAVPYTLDPTHSAVKFSWGHGEFSTTFGMFFEVQGMLNLDVDDPVNSSVTASMPLDSMLVDPTLKGHLASDRFFGGMDGKMIEFTSTSIELTGDETALVTGDLTIAGTTSEVVLDAQFNTRGEGPMGGEVAGFDATTTILRSDFNIGWLAPFISDEMDVEISIEASPVS